MENIQNDNDKVDANKKFANLLSLIRNSKDAMGQIISRPTTDLYYDVMNENRGRAIIFNHKTFKNGKPDPREGTEKDVASLKKVLDALDFEVFVFNDKSVKEIKDIIENFSSLDHSNCDMLWVTVMSHGKKGGIWAYDTTYDVNDLMTPFTGNNCSSLVGKPKLFFIQACRGVKTQGAVKMLSRSSDTVDSEISNEDEPTYYIPALADFLFMYSTVEDHYSFRNSENGTWFIQALCKEFENPTEDLQTILTKVNRTVAFAYQSFAPGKAIHEKKQVPQVVHQLTKVLYFHKKLR